MDPAPVSLSLDDSTVAILLLSTLISLVVFYLIVKYAVMNAIQDYDKHAASRHRPPQDRVAIPTGSFGVTGVGDSPPRHPGTGGGDGNPLTPY